jgi:hypothetical protein
MKIMKNVPLGAWIFASVALVAVLAAFVVLGITGTDTAELRWLILTILNAGAGLASVGGIVYSGAAAKSAHQAAEQTNGQLDDRIATAVAGALQLQRAADVAPGGEFRREDA